MYIYNLKYYNYIKNYLQMVENFFFLSTTTIQKKLLKRVTFLPCVNLRRMLFALKYKQNQVDQTKRRNTNTYITKVHLSKLSNKFNMYKTSLYVFTSNLVKLKKKFDEITIRYLFTIILF